MLALFDEAAFETVLAAFQFRAAENVSAIFLFGFDCRKAGGLRDAEVKQVNFQKFRFSQCRIHLSHSFSVPGSSPSTCNH
jgi:hypothetical protein